MHSQKPFITCAFLTALLLFLVLPATSHALTVGPVKIELSGDPGQTLDGEFMLFNEGEETKTFYPAFEKYTEVDGQKKFTGEKTDVASWIQTDENVTLASKEQKKIPFTIKLPKDAPAGSHFAVAWWGTAPAEAKPGTQVAIISRAGILMLLNVSGDLIESGSIAKFDLPSEKRFLNFFPRNFTVLFENTGNVYSKPIGDIKVKNIFGRASAIFDVNKVELETYPKTQKGLRVTPKNQLEAQKEISGEGSFLNQIKNEWNNFGIGPYKAEMSLSYGKNPKNLKQSFWFYILPWRILLLSAIIFIALLLFFTKGIKSYNNWIIKRAQKIYEKTSNN